MYSLIKRKEAGRTVRTILLCMSFLILFSPFVSSVDYLGVFDQHDNITLQQTCATCSFVNISSVVDPDLNNLLSEVEMSQSGSFFTYDANSTFTYKIGRYIVSGFGDSNTDGSHESFAYSYDVKRGDVFGFDLSSSFAIVLFVIMILIGFFLLYMGYGEFSGFVFVVLGFIMLFNDFSIIFSFLFVGGGVALAFYGR